MVMSNDVINGISQYWDPSSVVKYVMTNNPNMTRSEAVNIVKKAMNQIKKEVTGECCQYYKVVSSVNTMARVAVRQ